MWECHVRVNDDKNNFNNEGMLIVPLFFAILLFFPSGSKYFKTKLEDAISVVYAGGVYMH